MPTFRWREGLSVFGFRQLPRVLKGSIHKVHLDKHCTFWRRRDCNKTNCTSCSLLAFRLEIPLARGLLTSCSRKNTQVINVRAKHLALLLPLPEVAAYVGSYAQYPDGECSCLSLVLPGTVTWLIATARLCIFSSPSVTVYLTIEGSVTKTSIKCQT